MGFYLKKSIKCGPLRFNLSNSGIGISTGVKGLRVGVDGKGRTYIGGGKGILRYRKQLSSPKGGNSADNAGIWKILSIILFLVLILTIVYFIAPNTLQNLFLSLFS